MAIQQKTVFNLKPINQCVRVTFNYDVHFTRGLFQLDNPLLAQAIAADGETAPKQVLAVVDAIRALKIINGGLYQMSLHLQVLPTSQHSRLLASSDKNFNFQQHWVP
ncbi:hypothetical protein [Nostoc sp. UHCC 0252]|uniref:hypothetical protein n=1 Tax=Nostoc sp. UHCC 0252 TaxID=3110241 RepID=UPI002B1FC876|nr:hypothetical protein [Nostoc sp. UHCC 0252]MEA5601245.1 hypothetical protein [Nostoc sp. UHCC 0252]